MASLNEAHTPDGQTPQDRGKPIIHVLGGGMGSLSAAFYLSSPGWRERFAKIVVYEDAQRLGGKGASWREEDTGRVIEHGLHVWFGFYENSFRMLRDCHEELNQLKSVDGNPIPRWSSAMTSVDDSFRRLSRVTLMDDGGTGWQRWDLVFPANPGTPWDRDLQAEPPEWTIATYLARSLKLAATMARSLPGMNPAIRDHVTSVAGDWRWLGDLLGFNRSRARGTMAGDSLDSAAELLFQLGRMAARDPDMARAVEGIGGVIARLIDLFADALRLRMDETIRLDDELRRGWYVVDLVLTVARGLLADGIVLGADLDAIDGEDFCDWLRRHGAMEESVTCTIVRSIVYDMAFAYKGGNPFDPACGAGTALRGLFRLLFTYRGEIIWKMNGGMGDVVVAPLYELLCKRGVEFLFEHTVTDLHTAPGPRIGSFGIQKGGDPETTGRDRLAEWQVVPEPGSTVPAPSAASEAAEQEHCRRIFGMNTGLKKGTLMCWKEDRPPVKASPKEHTLPDIPVYNGDIVVFGLSLGSVGNVAKELLNDNPRWQEMHDKMGTVATQSVQLWLNCSAEDLGWSPDALVGGFLEPYDTWSDMPLLSKKERDAGEKTVFYLCSVSRDELRRDRVTSETVSSTDLNDFLSEDAGFLWGAGGDRIVTASPPNPLKDRLVGEPYVRVNGVGSERYVLSLPGTSQYRIEPDDTGFSNLYIVGDWTRCTLNAGCVEAAVISGMIAAKAIRGDLTVPIIGHPHP
jgi:uncharacterized protein with NAD-binding domain and iron-sulfur cluster